MTAVALDGRNDPLQTINAVLRRVVAADGSLSPADFNTLSYDKINAMLSDVPVGKVCSCFVTGICLQC